MFKSPLYALGAAVVAVSAINPAQAANPEARVTTGSEVCAMLREDLGLKFTVDDDGDIKVPYKEGFTVWVSCFDDEGNRVNPNTNKKISRIKFMAIPLLLEDGDFAECQEKADRYGLKSLFKFFPKRAKDGRCYVVMERFELITPESRRGPIVTCYKYFVKALSAVNE